MAMPLFAAVVGWKDGEVFPGAGSWVGREEEVVVEVTVVSIDDISLEGNDDDVDDVDAEVDMDVDVAELSPLVDDGAGPFPATLFGHR